MRPLVLASASPRRREILGKLGLTFEVQSADIDESQEPGERPDMYVIMSGAKAPNSRGAPAATALFISSRV